MVRVRIDEGELVVLARQGGLVRADDGLPVVDRRANRDAVIEPRAVVVLDRDDAAGLDAAVAAGAGAFLFAPVSPAALAAAVTIAGRQRRRRAGEGGDDVDALLAAHGADDGPVAVVIVALTRFEIVNAAFGRAAGDRLLAAAEARLAALLTGEARIVRRDGAELMIVAADAPTGIHEVMARPFRVGGVRVNLGSRIGIATRRPGEPVAQLLARAEAALDGGAGARRLPDGVEQLAADLHHAIERDEIELLLQPQVSLATGRMTGVEALARWRHGVLGELGADALFAAADRADLGTALSDHIHRLALARAAAWPAMLGDLRLSINVTAGDLARRDFAARFLALVADSGFPAGRLTVEVTETGLIERLDEAAGRLAELRAAGIATAIDDFGTGYSSLAYLKALPLDYLKIDRALAQDVTGSDRDRVIVRSVIAMARALGMATIAEGVETAAQAAALAAEGCTCYQGFLCAGPLDEPSLIALMEKQCAA